MISSPSAPMTYHFRRGPGRRCHRRPCRPRSSTAGSRRTRPAWSPSVRSTSVSLLASRPAPTAGRRPRSGPARWPRTRRSRSASRPSSSGREDVEGLAVGVDDDRAERARREGEAATGARWRQRSAAALRRRRRLRTVRRRTARPMARPRTVPRPRGRSRCSSTRRGRRPGRSRRRESKVLVHPVISTVGPIGHAAIRAPAAVVFDVAPDRCVSRASGPRAEPTSAGRTSPRGRARRCR